MGHRWASCVTPSNSKAMSHPEEQSVARLPTAYRCWSRAADWSCWCGQVTGSQRSKSCRAAAIDSMPRCVGTAKNYCLSHYKWNQMNEPGELETSLILFGFLGWQQEDCECIRLPSLCSKALASGNGAKTPIPAISCRNVGLVNQIHTVFFGALATPTWKSRSPVARETPLQAKPYEY